MTIDNWCPLHSTPLHGPGPWTTPNFQRGIAPVDMKIYQRLVFIAYVLEGVSRKSGLLWDRNPINRKTTNSFCDTEDVVHFYLQYFHSNTQIAIRSGRHHLPTPYK